jgi:hypothetical protein
MPTPIPRVLPLGHRFIGPPIGARDFCIEVLEGTLGQELCSQPAAAHEAADG